MACVPKPNQRYWSNHTQHPRAACHALGACPSTHLCSSEKDSVRVCRPPRLSTAGMVSPFEVGPLTWSRSAGEAGLAA